MSDFRRTHATQLRALERRHLLRGGLSLGALTMLTGCDLSTHDGLIDRALWAMLRFNDRVQATLFNPNRLAATFTRADITHPFKFNAYYPIEQVRPGLPEQCRLTGAVPIEASAPRRPNAVQTVSFRPLNDYFTAIFRAAA